LPIECPAAPPCKHGRGWAFDGFIAHTLKPGRFQGVPAASPHNRIQKTGLVSLNLLALLICDAAACLAGTLAGGLALAASAVLKRLNHIARIQSINVLHIFILTL